MKKARIRKSRPILSILCIFFVCICVLIAAMAILNGRALESDNPPSSQKNTLPQQETTGTAATTSTDKPTDPMTPNATAPSEAPSKVPSNYFDDALFIGNSRTEGLMLYADLGDATFLAHKGLMVDTAFTKKFVKSGSDRITVVEALKRGHYGKVYVMLGMNELGWAYDTIFIQKYGELVDAIRAAQPDAEICLQSILPVTATKSNSDPIYNNSKIESYNRLIQQLATEKGARYLNVAEAVGADGVLPEEGATDGVHLKPTYCEKWASYLKSHPIS